MARTLGVVARFDQLAAAADSGVSEHEKEEIKEELHLLTAEMISAHGLVLFEHAKSEVRRRPLTPSLPDHAPFPHAPSSHYLLTSSLLISTPLPSHVRSTPPSTSPCTRRARTSSPPATTTRGSRRREGTVPPPCNFLSLNGPNPQRSTPIHRQFRPPNAYLAGPWLSNWWPKAWLDGIAGARVPAAPADSKSAPH